MSTFAHGRSTSTWSSADERATIEQKVGGVIGPTSRIIVRQVASIARRSGKRRVTVSLANRA